VVEAIVNGRQPRHNFCSTSSSSTSCSIGFNELEELSREIVLGGSFFYPHCGCSLSNTSCGCGWFRTGSITGSSSSKTCSSSSSRSSRNWVGCGEGAPTTFRTDRWCVCLWRR
jgi:hypothetical protein